VAAEVQELGDEESDKEESELALRPQQSLKRRE
jgi:hypothetical protein